jgi:HPt (histidine-containing phosphotransfer) domain-containing protein
VTGLGIAAEQVVEAVSAEPAPEPSRPVDLTHLARQTFGQRELEQEVLRLFLRHTSLQLERLKAAGDIAGQRAAAHFIKGSARGIGAWQVATAADIVERFPDPDGEAIRTLSSAVEEANAFITTLLDD